MFTWIKDWLRFTILKLRLRNGEPGRRAQAAADLVEFGSRAFSPLVAALVEKDSKTWNAVDRALCHLRDIQAVAYYEPALTQAHRAETALATVQLLCDSKGFESLLATYQEGDSQVLSMLLIAQNTACFTGTKEAIKKILSNWYSDSRIVPLLLGSLKYGSPKAREAAAESFDYEERLRLPIAIAPLISALTDSERFVRAHAAGALGKIGDSRAVDSLLAMLKDEDTYARKCAARALGAIGEARCVESLLLAYDTGPSAAPDAGPYERSLANDFRRDFAQAICGASGTRGFGPLLELLDHSSPEIRWRAARMLGLVRLNKEGRLTFSEYGFDSKDTTTPPVDQLLARTQDPSAEVRSAAATTLGKIGTKSAFEELSRLLNDDALAVRAAATAALGGIGDPRGYSLLCDRLQDPSVEIRAAAAGAIGRLGDESTLQLLSKTLEDPVEAVRSAAATSVIQLARKFARADRQSIIDLLVNARLCPALCFLGDERAIPSLVAAMRHAGGTYDSYWSRDASDSQCLRALELILEKDISKATVADLKSVSEIADFTVSHWVMSPPSCYPNWDGFNHETISCGTVRQLARQEALRRGITL